MPQRNSHAMKHMKRPVAVVTGGTSQIGSAICEAVASRGYDLFILYRTSRDSAEKLVTHLTEQYGTRNTSCATDLQVLSEVNSALCTAIKNCGRIDLLVNNASAFLPTSFPFRVQDVSRWRAVLDATFWGTLYCCNAVVPSMRKRSYGHIINIADVYAELPLKNYGAHCVAKAALLALTRQLAVELAPVIRVNAISPGPIAPPVGKEHASHADKYALLERWGGSESVARSVLYLDSNTFVTGEVLTVDGGRRYVGVQR